MDFLISSIYPKLPEMMLRLVIACFCGGVIGFERSMRFKEAGIRTHVIACCAAALFMLISKYGFADISIGEAGTRGADAARVAAGVVSGISFLCAGVIIRVGGNVHGLTTAVGLWLTAAVGLSVGAGMYGLGAFATVLIVGFQSFLHHITFGHDSFHYVNVKIVVGPEFDFEHLKQLVTEGTGGVIEDVAAEHRSDQSVFEFVLRTRVEVGADEWKQIMDKDPSIESISHKSVAKS